MSDPDLRDELSKELSRLSEDILYTEKGHFAGADRWARIQWGVGISTVLAGVGSAATIIVNSAPVLAAALAVVASAGGAVQTLLRPAENRDTRLRAGRELGALRVEIRQVNELELPFADQDQLSQIRSKVGSLARKKAKIDARSPSVPPSAYRVGQEAIKAGQFEHDSIA